MIVYSILRRAGRLGLLAAALLVPRRAPAQIFADVQTTLGGFSLELFHEDVPRTVANFVSLAEGSRPWINPATRQLQAGVPYYDGIIFHRVIPNFMIQGGSPQGTGTDGPGYKFPDELVKGPSGRLLHTHAAAGMISMANSGIHTNGSQFFITTSVTPPATFPTHLDDKHTVFGRIVDGPGGTAAQGQAVVDAIAATPRSASDKPLTPVVMETLRIRRAGASAEAFDAQAWALPTVGGEVEATTTFTPGTAAGTLTQMQLSYASERYRAHAYEESTDLDSWSSIGLSSGPVTPIRTTASIRTYTHSNLDETSSFYLRVREIDYVPLIAQTLPPLSATASLQLRFSTPSSFTSTLALSPAGGTWDVAGPPAASGPAVTTEYFPGSGDAGLFSPLLRQTYVAAPFPWPGTTSLRLLQITLTFNPGSLTEGYFSALGLFTTNSGSFADVRGKGVFTVVAP